MGFGFQESVVLQLKLLSFLERKFTGVPQCELHQEANWGTSFSPICVWGFWSIKPSHHSYGSLGECSSHWPESSLPEVCAVRCERFSDILFFNFWKWLCIYIFWLHWVFIAAHGLSLVVASGGYSSLWYTGFSLQWLLLWSMGARAHRLQQLRRVGSVARHLGLVVLWKVGPSRARDQTRVPCIGRWILSPWTTREVLPGFQAFLNEQRCPGYFNCRVPWTGCCQIFPCYRNNEVSCKVVQQCSLPRLYMPCSVYTELCVTTVPYTRQQENHFQKGISCN